MQTIEELKKEKIWLEDYHLNGIFATMIKDREEKASIELATSLRSLEAYSLGALSEHVTAGKRCFVPIVVGNAVDNHWCCIVVESTQNGILIRGFNPYGEVDLGYTQCLKEAMWVLEDVYRRSGVEKVEAELTHVPEEEKQKNSWECGYKVLDFVEQELGSIAKNGQEDEDFARELQIEELRKAGYTRKRITELINVKVQPNEPCPILGMAQLQI